MLNRVIRAVAVGFVAGLICLLLSVVLPAIHVEVITSVGDFLGTWAWPIGIVVGLLEFVRGSV